MEKKTLIKKQIPQSSMFKGGVTYSLTITFIDQHQFWTTKCSRAYRFVEWFLPLIHKMDNYCKYKLYLEVSKSGRLHFHGTIIPNDTLEFQLYGMHMLLNMFGKIEIDTIDDPKYWEAYCTKDSPFWQPLVANWDMKYPITSKSHLNEPNQGKTIMEAFGNPISEKRNKNVSFLVQKKKVN